MESSCAEQGIEASRKLLEYIFSFDIQVLNNLK
jgi:hypothetical protein